MSSTTDKNQRTTAAERLATPVQYLKGVGPERAKLLARLGLATATDVLFFFPRDYQDLSDQRDVADLEEDVVVSVRGTVEEVDLQSSGFGKSRVGVLVRQGNEFLRAIWFNQPYMRDKFARGQHVLFSGKARQFGGRWQMAHPRVTWLEDEHDQPAGTILPVYPLTEGLEQHQIRRVVARVVEDCAAVPDEVFPAVLLAQYDLLPIEQALRQIHAPSSEGEVTQARRRFIFQELFILQLALALRRWEQHDQLQAPALPTDAKIDARISRLLPFELTESQREVIAEIAADMAERRPMNRLLHGEVGSGKTVVAAYAMLLAVAHRHQAVLMAPTEVLARQHADTLGAYLAASHVRTALVVGGLGAKKRRRLVEEIAAGRIDLVIGTQAVVQDDLTFAKLGLVVIDEQHKFGVRQRARLKQSGLQPHYLVMTATPIPRTVSMTQFGDLDVSILRGSPAGRQEVHTYLVEADSHEQWWEFVRNKLREGRQGYVVTPLVEESAEIQAGSVEQAFEQLADGPLEAFRLGLIHGRMSSVEKDSVMADFRSGKTQVLVATSVVEVGVDVPNATLMTIDSAERFGLAQLHQLRGRVSRGRHTGYCGVVADPKTDAARDRLAAFIGSTDGFHLAEVDFQLRGPGDLLGTRQHGQPPLRIADLVRDAALLEEARREAQKLVAADPGLVHADHARLRHMALARYRQALDLGDVG